MCGLWSNLKEWEDSVAAHEQRHEDGANNCLESGSAARAVLVEMEQFTGADASDVKGRFDDAFLDFRNGPFRKAMETATSTAASPVIWEWRDNGAWTLQALAAVPHNGTNGC